MGRDNLCHINLKSRIQVERDSIFNNREQQVEMRRPQSGFAEIVEHDSTLAAERSN
jgi:hypothetical protein